MGQGKSNLCANVAVALAGSGKLVAVVDTDIQSPGLHLLFGVEDTTGLRTLNDYLWERCAIRETATDVTPASIDGGGRVWLVPSSLQAGEIGKVLREGYDVGLLNDGFRDLIEDLELDYLLIDTHPGLNEETLLSIAISDELVILLRPDRQDFLGTAVTVEVARKLGVKGLVMVLNKVLPSVAERGFREEVERIYGAPVIGVLPEFAGHARTRQQRAVQPSLPRSSPEPGNPPPGGVPAVTVSLPRSRNPRRNTAAAAMYSAA